MSPSLTTLAPLTIEEAFHESAETFSLEVFTGKNILIYGSASPLGQELSALFVKSPCANLILWDQNVSDLIVLDRNLSTKKATFLSKTSCDEGQLESLLKEHVIDLVLNLKSFAALKMEHLDTPFPLKPMWKKMSDLCLLAKKQTLGIIIS